MKRSKFSDQQIAFVLRQAEEGIAVAEVCSKAGGQRSEVLQMPQKIRRAYDL